MISQSRYIDIISGVGAGAAVAQRQLILRLITQNSLMPPGVVAQFSTADAVGAYFGSTSEEYARALKYFKFLSKSITSPRLLSFARWVSSAIAPMIVGDTAPKTVADFAGITAGTLTLTSGAVIIPITAIDTSAAATMVDVADAVQTAIRVSTDPQLTTATVTWNSNTNQFVLTGAVTSSGNLSCTPTGISTDLSQKLGWATTGSVLVAGQPPDSPDQAVAKSASISNNFGSFCFCTPSSPMTNNDIKAVADWNAAQNNMYMYSVMTPLANLSALFALVTGDAGTALNVRSTTMPNDYVDQCPCEILAATDYTTPNAAQNYMFYQFADRNITVSDDATADTADTYRGNYIGVTQQAGQQLAFYQRGVLCGGSQDATDMNTYANEMWLKSAFTVQFFSLFLNMPEVPADTVGEAMLLGVMQPVIDQGKLNGTIAAGKDISPVQRQYITQVSNDPNAWRQVQTIGYWLDIDFSSYVNENSHLTEWQADYTFIYSKSDAIRVVHGRDILI